MSNTSDHSTTNDQSAGKLRKPLMRRLLSPWMLLAVVAAGLLTWVGVQVQRRRAENQALAQLKSVEDGRTFNIQLANPFQPDDPPAMEILFTGGPQWLIDWLGVDLFKTMVGFQASAPGNSFSYGVDDEGRLVINRTYQSGIGGDETRLLGAMGNLRTLHLEAHPVGDEIGPVLDRLPRLESLNLANAAVSDAVLPHIARSKRLESLNLSRTDVTDAGLEHLAGSSTLVKLNVSMTNVSEECIERLRQRLPHCQIEH